MPRQDGRAGSRQMLWNRTLRGCRSTLLRLPLIRAYPAQTQPRNIPMRSIAQQEQHSNTLLHQTLLRLRPRPKRIPHLPMTRDSSNLWPPPPPPPPPHNRISRTGTLSMANALKSARLQRLRRSRQHPLLRYRKVGLLILIQTLDSTITSISQHSLRNGSSQRDQLP